MENKSTNKNKSLKTITYEPYMKRIVEAVVDDYKFLGKEFKYIEDVIDYVNNSIKDSPYYSSKNGVLYDKSGKIKLFVPISYNKKRAE